MSIKYGAQVAGYEYTFYNQLHNRNFCEIPFHYLIYFNTKPTNEIFIRTNFPFFAIMLKTSVLCIFSIHTRILCPIKIIQLTFST